MRIRFLLRALAAACLAGAAPLAISEPAQAAPAHAKIDGWYGTWALNPGNIKLVILPTPDGGAEGQIWEIGDGPDGLRIWRMTRRVDFATDYDEASETRMNGSLGGGYLHLVTSSTGTSASGEVHGSKSESWSAQKVVDDSQTRKTAALLAAFGGAWSGKTEQWWLVSMGDEGAEVKIESGNLPYREEATILVDAAASSTTRLKGVNKTPNGDVFDTEMTLAGDRQSLIAYTGSGGAGIPGLLRRVDGLGKPPVPEIAKVGALLERMAATVWNTPFGRLAFSKGSEGYAAQITDAASGKIRYKLDSRNGIDDLAEFNQIEWNWAPVEATQVKGVARAILRTVLSADGKSFYVGYHPAKERDAQRLGDRERWTATKYGASSPAASTDPNAGATGPGGSTGTPAPSSQPDPVPSPQPAPSPQPTPQPVPLPAGDGSFRQLEKYDVRLDRVETPRDDKLVHIYLTLKNATQSQQYVTSGVVQVQLRDSEGATKQSGQVLRAVAGPLQHFGSTPVLQPGDELKVQFAFPLDAGASPSRVIVVEGAKRAEF